MILDACCIMLALLTTVLNDEKIKNNIEEKIVGRYLNLAKTNDAKKNVPYSAFSDEDAINKIFISYETKETISDNISKKF